LQSEITSCYQLTDEDSCRYSTSNLLCVWISSTSRCETVKSSCNAVVEENICETSGSVVNENRVLVKCVWISTQKCIIEQTAEKCNYYQSANACSSTISGMSCAWSNLSTEISSGSCDDVPSCTFLGASKTCENLLSAKGKCFFNGNISSINSSSRCSDIGDVTSCTDLKSKPLCENATKNTYPNFKECFFKLLACCNYSNRCYKEDIESFGFQGDSPYSNGRSSSTGVFVTVSIVIFIPFIIILFITIIVIIRNRNHPQLSKLFKCVKWINLEISKKREIKHFIPNDIPRTVVAVPNDPPCSAFSGIRVVGPYVFNNYVVPYTPSTYNLSSYNLSPYSSTPFIPPSCSPSPYGIFLVLFCFCFFFIFYFFFFFYCLFFYRLFSYYLFIESYAP
jgi:hypothetical protein